MGLQMGKFHSETIELWPLIYVIKVFFSDIFSIMDEFR